MRRHLPRRSTYAGTLDDLALRAWHPISRANNDYCRPTALGNAVSMARTSRARTARVLCVALLLLSPFGCTYTDNTYIAYAVRYRGPGTPNCAVICQRHQSSPDAHSKCLRACPGAEEYNDARCDYDAGRIISFSREEVSVVSLGEDDTCIDVVHSQERELPMPRGGCSAPMGPIAF